MPLPFGTDQHGVERPSNPWDENPSGLTIDYRQQDMIKITYLQYIVRKNFAFLRSQGKILGIVNTALTKNPCVVRFYLSGGMEAGKGSHRSPLGGDRCDLESKPLSGPMGGVRADRGSAGNYLGSREKPAPYAA
jgi:hypothetical protein